MEDPKWVGSKQGSKYAGCFITMTQAKYPQVHMVLLDSLSSFHKASALDVFNTPCGSAMFWKMLQTTAGMSFMLSKSHFCRLLWNPDGSWACFWLYANCS